MESGTRAATYTEEHAASDVADVTARHRAWRLWWWKVSSSPHWKTNAGHIRIIFWSWSWHLILWPIWMPCSQCIIKYQNQTLYYIGHGRLLLCRVFVLYNDFFHPTWNLKPHWNMTHSLGLYKIHRRKVLIFLRRAATCTDTKVHTPHLI